MESSQPQVVYDYVFHKKSLEYRTGSKRNKQLIATNVKSDNLNRFHKATYEDLRAGRADDCKK